VNSCYQKLFSPKEEHQIFSPKEEHQKSIECSACQIQAFLRGTVVRNRGIQDVTVENDVLIEVQKSESVSSGDNQGAQEESKITRVVEEKRHKKLISIPALDTITIVTVPVPVTDATTALAPVADAEHRPPHPDADHRPPHPESPVTAVTITETEKSQAHQAALLKLKKDAEIEKAAALKEAKDVAEELRTAAVEAAQEAGRGIHHNALQNLTLTLMMLMEGCQAGSREQTPRNSRKNERRS